MKKSFILSTVIVFSVFNIVSAHAAEPMPTEKVWIGDLDLTAAAGKQTMQRRINRAVASLCGTDDIRNLASRRATTECLRVAQASTRTQVVVAMTNAERRKRSASLRIEKTAAAR